MKRIILIESEEEDCLNIFLDKVFELSEKDIFRDIGIADFVEGGL